MYEFGYVIRYEMPVRWMQYDPMAIVRELTEAKSAVLSLSQIPFQRSWVEALQQVQLKSEVAGTSKIEGAEFTETEFEAALTESPQELFTRSQRQAHAAVRTYKWIAQLPSDVPINADLLKEVHRQMVTGADDDHCPPGQLRRTDQNVTFGTPPHRGAEGGHECNAAFSRLCEAVQHEFRDHDPLIQALALHYHFAAIHPFLDGNGRTARALEALVLQRSGLRDALFIAMSNYYYDEKASYLAELGNVRASGHDLTPFLIFGLRGIALQCRRLFAEIKRQVSKALFRNVMFDLFDRLKTPRKRVLAKRQTEILKLLLEVDAITLHSLTKRTHESYRSLKDPISAIMRDLIYLRELGAIAVVNEGNGEIRIAIRLEWPTEITETRFFEVIKNLPKAKPHSLSL